MDIDNTINYWLNIKSFNEAKEKVITGSFEESIKKDLQIIEKMDIQKTDRVLDFGCGIGRLTQPVSETCNEILGIDISDKMIGHATKYCKGNNILFKSLNNEEGSGLPLNCIDKAFSFLVIQHIEKPKVMKILLSILKSLKIEGQMLIQFPNLERNEEMYKQYLMSKQNSSGLDPRMEFYTSLELKYIFELLKVNYQIIEIETDYYVLATKKENVDLKQYFAMVEKWD